jgi:uncharacterized protein YdaU (DUF1376 family)
MSFFKTKEGFSNGRNDETLTNFLKKDSTQRKGEKKKQRVPRPKSRQASTAQTRRPQRGKGNH